MKRSIRSIAMIALGALWFGVSAYGQVTTATIYGNVLDPSGAAVAQAAVSATNELTSASFNATSDERGEFTLTFLPVGPYTLSIKAPGFKEQKQTGLELTGGQRLRTNYTLAVGEVTENVTVTAEAALLNTVAAEQREGITERQTKELPLFRRDWTNLVNIGTGVATNSTTGGVSLNGLPPASFRLTVDGTDASGDPELPSLSMYQNFNLVKTVSLEAISEVQVAKGIASAEIANTMSGNVNLITKSGTNDFHGSLFENYQGGKFQGRPQFLTTKPPVVYNQFGGSVGGPIIKNKLFFFGVYEGYRQKRATDVRGTVPTQEFRAQAIAAVPAYKAFFDLNPLPNQPYPTGSNTGVFQGAGSNDASDNHVVARGDYHLTDNNLISGRYTRGRPFQQQPRFSEFNPRDFNGTTEAVTASFTHTRTVFSSETRFGYTKNDVRRVDGIYDTGVPGIVGNLGFGFSGETLFKGGSTTSLEEVLALTRGRHSIKLGGLFMRFRAGRDNIESPEIRYFNLADFLADIAGQAQVTYGVNPFSMRQWQTGYFIQDDFKVRSNLVLNLGIRYDYFSVPNERDGRLFNRSEPFGFGSLRPADSIYNADYNNFSPRFGFAWTVDSAAKTVVRGGFGMFINPHTIFGGPVETVRNAIDEPSRFIFSRDDVIRLGLKYPITNAGTLQYVKNPNAPWSGTAINTDFPNPYSLQWTLSVQRQLTGTLALESAFVGNRGVKLNMVRDENLVDRQTGLRNPAFGQFRYYDTSESSHYSAWQTSLRKRFSQDLSFNVHYTWATSISYQDGDLLLPDRRPQDNNNLALEKGPSPYDIRHRFVSDFLYELPFARLTDASTRGKKLLLAGWQFSGIYAAESGFPFHIGEPSYAGARVDYAGGNALLNDASRPLQYLNRSAFARPPINAVSGVASRPGTLGRNALRGPGLWNIDLALSKTLAISERVGLQIRADMINAFNHTNFGPVPGAGATAYGIQTNINASDFGAFTSTRGARLVQFNARLTF